MASSGSVDFSVSRDDIITEALQYCGVLADGETPDATQLTSCSRTLNLMVKSWINKGAGLWVVQKATLFLEKDKGAYNVGPTGDHITESYGSTALSVAGVDTDTTISVDSITGISDGDYIGIILDDNTSHWTTVNGAPSGSTVTLTDALDGAAAIDNKVYFYTTKTDRARRVMNLNHHNLTSGNDIPMIKISREDYYHNFGNKTTNGQPTNAYFDPQLGNSVLYVYPEPDRSDNAITLTYLRPLEDFDTATDTPDFPQEWYGALCWNLAKWLMVKYGTPSQSKQEIKMLAGETLAEALMFDTEDTSLYLEVNKQGK